MRRRILQYAALLSFSIFVFIFARRRKKNLVALWHRDGVSRRCQSNGILTPPRPRFAPPDVYIKKAFPAFDSATPISHPAQFRSFWDKSQGAERQRVLGLPFRSFAIALYVFICFSYPSI